MNEYSPGDKVIYRFRDQKKTGTISSRWFTYLDYYYDIKPDDDNFIVSIPSYDIIDYYNEKKCECGSIVTNQPKHSYWCDLFEE